MGDALMVMNFNIAARDAMCFSLCRIVNVE